MSQTINLKNDLKFMKQYTLKSTMNKTKAKKIKSNTKTMKIDDILKIKLKKDNLKNLKEGKEPTNEWTKPYNQSKNYKATPNNNVGIVCNKISGAFGADLDFYNKDGTPYDFDKCLFCKEFGKPEEFIKKFNTYTQRTANGGIHLVFQHEEGLKQCQNKELHIDTRGGESNGYLVGYDSTVNGKKYTVELEQTIKPIPKELLKWFNEVYWTNENTATTIPSTPTKHKQTTAVKQHKEKKLECIFGYNFIEAELVKLLLQLPKTYFTTFLDWQKFTSGMKQLGKKKLWDKLSKEHGGKSYKKKENLEHWDEVANKFEDCFYFESLLKQIYKDTKGIEFWEMLGLVKFKPLQKREHNPDQTINMPYLTGTKTQDGYENGFDFSNGHMVIESDTGTGKTSGFKKYMIETNQPFLTIVSRRILAIEQHSDFCESLSGHIDYYENGVPDSNNQGFVCCLDSILKIENWESELPNRVVFLDEFNSLVEYLLSSPTMETKRVEIFDFVVNVLFKYAKQIICVDADISDISINFLKYIEKLHKKNFTFVKNTHKHNKGVEAQEYFSRSELIERASKEECFMFACDSKTEAVNIYKQLDTPENPIKLIVAREDEAKGTEEHINFKDYKRIIFSPKVIYGNDSVYKNGRPVFGYFLEKTISPTAFIQQIARERNITKLHYCFEKKDFEGSRYNNTRQVVEDIENRERISLERFEFRGDIKLQKMFLELSAQLEYKTDCYNSNKYVHFKRLLVERGFEDIIKEHIPTEKRSKAEKKLAKKNLEEWHQDIWNPEEALLSRLNLDLLKMETIEEIEKFKDLFLVSGAVKQHLLSMYLLLKEEKDLQDKIRKTNEFPTLMLNDSYCQLDTMFKLMKQFGYKNGQVINQNKNGEVIGHSLQIVQTEKVEVTDKMFYDFDTLHKAFFDRRKGQITKEGLSNPHSFKTYVKNMIVKVCGKNLMRNKKIRVGKKTFNQYSYNQKHIERTKKIMEANSENKFDAYIADLDFEPEDEGDESDEEDC